MPVNIPRFIAGSVAPALDRRTVRTHVRAGSPSPLSLLTFGRSPAGPPAPSVPGADLLEAVLAVHRPALRRQERHLRGRAAHRAGDLVHGAGSGDPTPLAPEGPALGAAARLVDQALGLVELLLSRRERELDPAVPTGQSLVKIGSHRYLLGTCGVTRTGAVSYRAVPRADAKV